MVITTTSVCPCLFIIKSVTRNYEQNDNQVGNSGPLLFDYHSMNRFKYVDHFPQCVRGE